MAIERESGMPSALITLVHGANGPKSGYRNLEVQVHPSDLQPGDKVLSIQRGGDLLIQRQVALTDDEMQLVLTGWLSR